MNATLTTTPRLSSASDRLRRIWFWVVRYGPPEVACLVTMLIASVWAAGVTDSPLLLAVAAIAGATVGFYGVLIVKVMREQLALLPAGDGRWGRAARRSTGLLAAEFGVAEVADTFLLRPALMMAGVAVLGDPVLGLIVAKVIADVLFYVLSAGCFVVTKRTGIRIPSERRGAELALQPA